MNHNPQVRIIRNRRQSGAISKQALALLLAAAVIALIVIYFLLKPATDVPETPGIVAPVTTPEERGDSARDLIEEIKSNPADVDLAEAHEQAGEFRAAGKLADAQLLYFFAARGNYAPAAFDLATMYDPIHFSSESSLMDEPNPSQAYKWYKVARDGGIDAAGERLEGLLAWVQDEASDGNFEAEQLLLRWE